MKSGMCSVSEQYSQPCFSFGVIADVQYADVEDGYNFARTNRRYYRTALTMLDQAVKMWNNNPVKKPQFILQLGDAIDGKNKHHNIARASLCRVIDTFSQFNGPVYHIWGNHEYYNFTRAELLASDLYSGNSVNCSAVNEKVYYSSTPHPKLRILALDCYEISLLASLKASKEYDLATEMMQNNCNEDPNSCEGLEGELRRFVKYNGALSDEQLRWMETNLEEAVHLKQNVIVMGHCGVYKDATDMSCLCWNAPEVLRILHKYSSCVLAYLSGHDHSGGMAMDDKKIQHIAFPGVLENNYESDFGTFYMYNDKLELVGNGRVPNLTLLLRYKLDSETS